MTKAPAKRFVFYLESYIKDCYKGMVIKKGVRSKPQSIQMYEVLLKYLQDFDPEGKYCLEISPAQKLSLKQLEKQKKIWNEFQRNFLDYLYDQKHCFDNYVGAMIKRIKSVLNWIENEKGIGTLPYRLVFVAPKAEKIPIIILNQKRLQYIVYSEEFKRNLPDSLEAIYKILLVGSFVALRYSDLKLLKRSNLEFTQTGTYLRMTSLKTQTETRVLLPDFVGELLQKQDKRQKYLLPQMSLAHFNKGLKKLGKFAGWCEDSPKVRFKRGEMVTVYKNPNTRRHFKFYEHLSSHLMRRTAITNMLILGMSEMNVRKISGHAPGSKEFFRYVSIAQEFLDKETEEYHRKLATLPI